MDAPSLKKLYESDLKQALRPPVAPGVDRRQIRYMLQRSRRTAPSALREDDHATIWISSDLHLGHAKSIKTFGRPFKTADEMSDEIFSNWQQTVGTEDTIIILGDVTVHGLWGQRLRRVREAPGRKILVYGNHEAHGNEFLGCEVFDGVHSTLYVDGDPPLLLTHIPLGVVPKGCVNIHGHLHHNHVPSSTRHINVCVEQLGYQPKTLTQLRTLAQHRIRTHTMGGGTTADQLDRIR